MWAITVVPSGEIELVFRGRVHRARWRLEGEALTVDYRDEHRRCQRIAPFDGESPEKQAERVLAEIIGRAERGEA